MQPADQLFSQYEILRALGRGGEGTVYLVEEKATGQTWVLKVRHEPIRGTATAGLKLYASQVAANPHGLPMITLLGGSDEIVAIAYPFAPLYPIYWRFPLYFERVAQALFGAYCRMQSYLLDRANIALLDTVKDNFMIAADGSVHFVDFGFGVRSAHHPQVVGEGRLGYGFAMMLLSLYNQNLKLEMKPAPGYAQDQPCVYCASQSLDRLAKKHGWVAEILAEVRSHPASILAGADFYQRIGDRLPSRLPWPTLMVGFTRLHHRWARIKTPNPPPVDKGRNAHPAHEI